MKNLGKSNSNSYLIYKILRYLSRTWEAKMTTIQKAQDLNNLSLEELIGSLMIHKLNIKQNNEEESRKKKIMALKSVTKDEEESDESNDVNKDEEMTLIIKILRRFMKKKRQVYKKKPL